MLIVATMMTMSCALRDLKRVTIALYWPTGTPPRFVTSWRALALAANPTKDFASPVTVPGL